MTSNVKSEATLLKSKRKRVTIPKKDKIDMAYVLKDITQLPRKSKYLQINPSTLIKQNSEEELLAISKVLNENYIKDEYRDENAMALPNDAEFLNAVNSLHKYLHMNND